MNRRALRRAATRLLLIPWLCAALSGVPVFAREPATGTDLAATARMIAQRALIADTHIDVPERLRRNWADVTRAAPSGDFDYERARRGGLNLAFMSIYTSPDDENAGGAFELANRLIDQVEALAGRAPERFALVSGTRAAARARELGRIGLALGMENGGPLEGKLENVAFFHGRGIRYITLAHAKSNHLADSSFDARRAWNGLSPFGREVVAEMNRLGMMIDVSHLSDAAFYQILELSRAPVIASHSSARRFTPGFERNMSDDMIRALAAHGGVIQINFGSIFLTAAASEWLTAMQPQMEVWAAENGHETGGVEAVQWMKKYRETHPFPRATLGDLVDHFDHAIALVGTEHVGIGSDFDGVGDTLPEGIRGVSDYPALIEEFLRRGYRPADIEAVLGGNLMRVWAEVEAISAGG